MSANSTALDNNEYITPRNRVREISPITIKTAEVDDQTKLILFKNLNLIKKTEEESPASRPAEEMREEELIPEDTLPLEEIISPEKEFIPVETPTLPGITVVDTSQEVKDRVLKNINTYTTSHISYDTTNYSAEEIIEVTKETIFKEITPYFVAIRSMIAEYDSAARNSHRQSFLKATILENIVYLQARLGNLLCDHFLKKNIIVPIDLVRKFFTNARSQYIPVNFRAIAGVANTPESSFLGAVSYASVLYNAERLKKLTVHRLESREDLNFFDLHHGTDMIIFDNPQYLPSKQTPAAVYLLDVKTWSDPYIHRLKPNASSPDCSYAVVKKRIREIAQEKGIDAETPLALFKLIVPTGVRMDNFRESNSAHTADWFMNNIRFRLREMYRDVQILIHWPLDPESASPESPQSE